MTVSHREQFSFQSESCGKIFERLKGEVIRYKIIFHMDFQIFYYLDIELSQIVVKQSHLGLIKNRKSDSENIN